MSKILYVFTGGRKARIKAKQASQDTPMEFLYGVPYLQQQGYDVDILELSDLHPDTSSPEFQDLVKTNTKINQQFRFTSSSHFFVGTIDQLNCYDVIISGGETTAFGLVHFKRKGLLKPPIIFFVMGMLAYIPTLKGDKPRLKSYRTLHKYVYNRFYNTRYRRGKQVYQELVQCSQCVLFLGKGEYEYAIKLFPRDTHKFHFLPFSVDTEFWVPPEKSNNSSPYILFMGNDRQRNFELVVKIAERLRQFHFKFVTIGIKQDFVPQNVELFAGDWKEAIFSDVDIRAFIQDSALVILPLKQTFKPSGQSVALQAMACGRPVIISKTEGFWEPDTFIDREHLWFVHSNSLDEWCYTIEHLMNDNTSLLTLGENARKLVERNNNLEKFGKRLENIIARHL